MKGQDLNREGARKIRSPTHVVDRAALLLSKLCRIVFNFYKLLSFNLNFIKNEICIIYCYNDVWLSV